MRETAILHAQQLVGTGFQPVKPTGWKPVSLPYAESRFLYLLMKTKVSLE
jgi:hypothetical protein